MRKKFSKKQKHILRLVRRATVVLFCLFMAVGTITGLMLPARPKTSAIEKRELTAFPAFTMKSFLDGSWFSQISLWYSDSYPGRDQFVAMNNTLQKAKGFQQKEMVIGGGKADEIGGKKKDNESEDDGKGFDERKQAPDVNVLQDDIQGQIMEGLLVKDGAAYGGYYFAQEAYDLYTSALERGAKELEGTTNVYSILVPNNSSIMLDDETYKKLSGSDQKQAIDYYYTNYSDLVHPVGTFDVLKSHNNENIYFKTDHHWTPLGAYYVYQSFCKTKGIEPVDKDELEYFKYEPFYGSYTSMLPGVELSPDVFEGWVPKGGNNMRVFNDLSGDPNSTDYYETFVVDPNEGIDQYNHYMRLISGDLPFVMIDNEEIDDGSSCLLIKESYGNAFAPWLVNNYDKVYVMDLRYSDIPIVTFCKENNVTDLIIMNNIQLGGALSVCEMLDSRMH